MSDTTEPSVIPFQARVATWMDACFGPEISRDKLERGDRLLEEVFELLQSGDYPRERIGALESYVYGREKGEPAQEAGGVQVTFAAYCLAHDIDMHEAGETELARVWTKVEAIRSKQAVKPTGSALPVAVSDAGQEVAWMNADHVRAYRDGRKDGIAWVNYEETEFYDVPLYTRIATLDADTGQAVEAGALAAGEASYSAYRKAQLEELADEPADLPLTLRMLDEWTAEALPANEHGQVPFARSIMDAAADSIRKHLAAHPAPLDAKRVRELEKALEPFAKFAGKAERFVEGRVNNGGSPILPVKDFCLADFQRARAALRQKEGKA